ncbi:3,4-dihydroxy-2-butanone-4-phosphate synthase [Sneathiella sp. HT1-7]|uniref:3,4-dihydroxy-2-butanone-4-phosphate synthase n=1 Tax=Sneathiella sp. HT1-7 TaxID=2887192 RepID=UPI001D146E71|nr:3,4-dihydroxy-2-butanone-4-phosphate synthase [Sneathiella sp. HT1-7]MCC3304765.1 3,4-dihydroxy-2-butanone-4-phosphate synthase [Sneathiella sp. HT1-7]
MSYKEYLASTEEIIEDARNGKMFVLVDAEDRENEGDLVIPAQMATPDVINFMAKFGRGLICLSMSEDRINHLGLPLMAQDNASRLTTNFTVSIEAREGVTTGISAADRARTIAVAIDPTKNAQDIVSPGHVFPLVAREGGVLRRAGHTEAAVDISRLAGLQPAGVICEIMNDDGTMARLPDLVKFAQFHGLKVGTIADLIAYRRRHDSLITREVEADISSKYGGDWKMIVFSNRPEYAEHVALVKGEVSGDDPVMVRMHALNLLGDVLGELDENPDTLHSAMEQINAAGKGVVVLIREPRAMALSDRVRRKLGEPLKEQHELRDYGIGAQILIDLGIKNMILLSNHTRTVVGLDGYGLAITETRLIEQKG